MQSRCSSICWTGANWDVTPVSACPPSGPTKEPLRPVDFRPSADSGPEPAYSLDGELMVMLDCRAPWAAESAATAPVERRA